MRGLKFENCIYTGYGGELAEKKRFTCACNGDNKEW